MEDKFIREVTDAIMESVGVWIVTTECGHRMYRKARVDCKKFPKTQFCGLCYQEWREENET